MGRVGRTPGKRGWAEGSGRNPTGRSPAIFSEHFQCKWQKPNSKSTEQRPCIGPWLDDWFQPPGPHPSFLPVFSSWLSSQVGAPGAHNDELSSPLGLCWVFLTALEGAGVRSLSYSVWAIVTGMTTHSSTPAWRIPWAEAAGGCNPWGRKEPDMTEHTPMLQHFTTAWVA